MILYYVVNYCLGKVLSAGPVSGLCTRQLMFGATHRGFVKVVPESSFRKVFKVRAQMVVYATTVWWYIIIFERSSVNIIIRFHNMKVFVIIYYYYSVKVKSYHIRLRVILFQNQFQRYQQGDNNGTEEWTGRPEVSGATAASHPIELLKSPSPRTFNWG